MLDGVMLSDGNVYPSRNSGEHSRYLDSYFRLQLGHVEHMDWLLAVKRSLLSLGVEFTPKYPRLYKRNCDDYVSSWLVSKVSPIMTAQRLRWYTNGDKVVPLDLKITPIVVANWFMGDGTSSFNRDGAVMVVLATFCFSDNEVFVLRNKLLGLGVNTGKAEYDNGTVITVLQSSIDDFMSVTKPYLSPSFSYKIKYRR